MIENDAGRVCRTGIKRGAVHRNGENMIKSMTGFGRSEVITEEYKMTVEMKAVNHRYCDIGIKLPKKFNAFENAVRSTVKEYASRGKIDIYISYEDYAGKRTKVDYHDTVARGYMDAIEKATVTFGIEKGISAAALIRMPDVIALDEMEDDEETLLCVLQNPERRKGSICSVI